MSNIDDGTRLVQESSYDMRDAGRPSLALASSDGPSSSTPCTTINTPHPPSKPHQAAAANTAPPAQRTFFDPWNSSSTGHQRAENRLSGSTSWRVSRNLKLGEQYTAGLDGGRRVADTVGAGSADFGNDGRKENGAWQHGAKGLRTGGQKSLVEVWAASKAGKTKPSTKENKAAEAQDVQSAQTDQGQLHGQDPDLSLQSGQGEPPTRPAEKHIFAGLCFYINGSTAPLVSDHKLKHFLAIHGAAHSIALGRRTVTHVILGTSNARGGAGGGLAATKIQKEIARTGGKTVKFVTAEWVLESIKAGRRLSESRFLPLKLASKSQNSVLSMLCTRQRDQG